MLTKRYIYDPWKLCRQYNFTVTCKATGTIIFMEALQRTVAWCTAHRHGDLATGNRTPWPTTTNPMQWWNQDIPSWLRTLQGTQSKENTVTHIPIPWPHRTTGVAASSCWWRNKERCRRESTEGNMIQPTPCIDLKCYIYRDYNGGLWPCLYTECGRARYMSGQAHWANHRCCGDRVLRWRGRDGC